MPSITPNLRLSITNRETNKPFLNWRLGIDGPDDSNMIKLDKAWGDMKTMVDGAMAAVGHAYTAATAADMTDHDKSYVYVGSETGYTNGNWYYWNEDQSAWVSGGVYNATALQTDDTLTLEGEAADAKATGEMIVINGTSSNGTRINITTTNEDVVIPTMDDVDDLKTQLNDLGVEIQISPNLLNPQEVLENTALNNDTGATFSANNYYTTGFIPVKATKMYSAFIKPGDSIQCPYVARICGYNSQKVFTESLGTISAGGTLSYKTIPTGTAYVRLMISKEYYIDKGPVMFCEVDGTNMPTEMVEYYNRTVLNGYAKTEDIENIESEIVNLNEKIEDVPRSAILLDTNKIKGILDNFHRSTNITEGYTSYGTSGRAAIEDSVAITNPGSGYEILKTNIGENQVLGISGDSITIAFNIKDARNFYYLRSNIGSGNVDGLQLYKRENNISTYISAKALTYKRGFLILHFVGTKIYIYNDYVFDITIDTNTNFDGSVGMVFGINGSEEYYTFGGMDYDGLECLKGFVSPHRLINNGSEESLTISNGEIKLLVDRAEGYSDHNYYRSMMGFKQIPYDNCYSKFSCDFKLDESLEGADDFLILQWHDNNLVGVGVSPFISINVNKDDGIYLGSRYSQSVPSGNLDCIVNPSIKIGELDYTTFHHIEIETRIGYDESTLPYLECKYDGELVYASLLPLGYKGQNGYNITFGIYGWWQWKTDDEWKSPASEKPFIIFKNVDYVG